jgi:hypothetical protein
MSHSSSEVRDVNSESEDEPAKRTRGTLQTMLGGGQSRVRPAALREPPLAVEALVASGEVSVVERDAGNQTTLDGSIATAPSAEPAEEGPETMLQMLQRRAVSDKRADRILRRVSTRGMVEFEHAQNLENLWRQPRESLLRRLLGIEHPAMPPPRKGKSSGKASSSKALAIEDAGKDPQGAGDAGKDPQGAGDAGKKQDSGDTGDASKKQDSGDTGDASKEPAEAAQVRAGFSRPPAIGGTRGGAYPGPKRS